jgi:hypothetical protein
MQNDPLAKPPPATRFEARQPDGGAALLFFIRGGKLVLAKEVSHPGQGWWHQDLSSGRIGPGDACTDFASALSVAAPGRTQMLHLAMVVNDGRNDRLYLSLSNPAAGWSAAPAWVACPFDAGLSPARVVITRVLVGDASDRPFIVADVVINPDSAAPRRMRYSIDAWRSFGPRWIEHRLPVDNHAGVYAACLGRCRGGWDVDGLYLAARGEQESQLLYAPLYNPFNPMQPRWSRRLELPGKLAAEAIAACRNADNTSDLYVTAQGGLYYFSATNQNACAQGLALGSAPGFEDLRTLFAANTGGRVTLWGLNGAGQVICTSAPQVSVADPAAWSEPEVVLSNVAALAPCPDRRAADAAFYARMPDGLARVARPPGSSGWRRDDVVLPAQDA